jgi:hypothetical protein
MDADHRDHDDARGLIGTLRERVTTLRGAVSNGMSDAGARVDEARTRATTRGRSMAHAVAENPLGVTLGAMALGFLAGLIIPITKLERERVGGPVRDAMVHQRQAAVEQAVETAREIVRDTLQAARSSARVHGVTIVRSESEKSPFASGDVKEV